MKKLVCLFIAVACILSVFTFSASAMSIAAHSYKTYIGYMFFTATNDPPDYFATYESVKAIGRFNHAAFPYSMTISHYGIVDRNSYKIFVTVEKFVPEENDGKYNEKLNVDKSDMRKINTSSLIESCYINDVRYTYYSGKLTYISFQKDGFEYTVSGEVESLSDYPLEKNDNTFIGKLLCNPDGAAELIESEIGGGEGYRFNFWLYVVILPTCVVAAVAIGAVILIRRKRMKNNQVNTAN